MTGLCSVATLSFMHKQSSGNIYIYVYIQNPRPITSPHRPQKRRLDDELPAHAIRSTRESSEDVTRTLDDGVMDSACDFDLLGKSVP